MSKLIRAIITLLFTLVFGFIIKYIVDNNYQIVFSENFKLESNSLFFIIITGVIAVIISYFFISPILTSKILKRIDKTEEKLNNMTIQEILTSIGGMILGLIIANLLGIPFLKYQIAGTVIVLLMNLILGYMGYKIAIKKNNDIKILQMTKTNENGIAKPKILDTSVIIDGRVLDILKTGFIEGKIIIPQFVLAELRHIADSSDSLKRNRGRRGLDILNEIQKQLEVPVDIIEKDYKTIPEVDSKLLKLAEELNATIVTNDFNLNKVADFKGVVVLNINELSNAIKPIVLPGEDMKVTVIKDGKEHEQGIAYLNDGTMIVVEGGRRAIGKTIEVLVTSVLQTAAGRMIFTKIKG